MKTSTLILAGGKSRRMNFVDKANLPLGGETFLSALYKRFAAHTSQIIISEGKETHRDYREEVKEADFVKDIYEDCGPLGGLYSGLKACKEKYLCVAACDMPYLEYQLYEYLLKSDKEEYDAILPTYQERIQPLAGIYKKRILPAVQKQLDTGDNTMKDLLKTLSVHYVEVADDNALARMLKNINTMEEYKEINS